MRIILITMLVFTAASLVCAVALAQRRGARVGRRCPPAADPFCFPFGEMPELSADAHLSNEMHRRAHAATHTREQLEEIARRPVELHHDTHSARPASRADQGSGGNGNSLSGAAAARPIRGRERRAF